MQQQRPRGPIVASKGRGDENCLRGWNAARKCGQATMLLPVRLLSSLWLVFLLVRLQHTTARPWSPRLCLVVEAQRVAGRSSPPTSHASCIPVRFARAQPGHAVNLSASFLVSPPAWPQPCRAQHVMHTPPHTMA